MARTGRRILIAPAVGAGRREGRRQGSRAAGHRGQCSPEAPNHQATDRPAPGCGLFSCSDAQSVTSSNGNLVVPPLTAAGNKKFSRNWNLSTKTVKVLERSMAEPPDHRPVSGGCTEFEVPSARAARNLMNSFRPAAQEFRSVRPEHGDAFLLRHDRVVEAIMRQTLMALDACVAERSILVTAEGEDSLVHPLGIEHLQAHQ